MTKVMSVNYLSGSLCLPPLFFSNFIRIKSICSLELLHIVARVFPVGELADPLLPEVLGSLKERMLEELFSGPPGGWVFVEALVTEVLEIW